MIDNRGSMLLRCLAGWLLRCPWDYIWDIVFTEGWYPTTYLKYNCVHKHCVTVFNR